MTLLNQLNTYLLLNIIEYLDLAPKSTSYNLALTSKAFYQLTLNAQFYRFNSLSEQDQSKLLFILYTSIKALGNNDIITPATLETLDNALENPTTLLSPWREMRQDLGVIQHFSA